MENTPQIGMQFKTIELLDTVLKAPQKALPKNLVFQYDMVLLPFSWVKGKTTMKEQDGTSKIFKSSIPFSNELNFLNFSV